MRIKIFVLHFYFKMHVNISIFFNDNYKIHKLHNELIYSELLLYYYYFIVLVNKIILTRVSKFELKKNNVTFEK